MAFEHYGPVMPANDVTALQDLVRLLGKPCVVEVGSWLGNSAKAMVEAGAWIVWCVDTWCGTDDPHDETHAIGQRLGHDRLFGDFCQNVGSEAYGTTIIPCIGTSEEWASRWPFEVDMVFLDADHRYEEILKDIRRWEIHIRPGGILAGHDFGGYHHGVSLAVTDTGPFERAGYSIWWRRIG